MDNSPLDSIPLESPLNKFSYNMDKKFSGKTIFDYYDFVEKVDPLYLTSLYFSDISFRYSAQLNCLVEIYGQQGCGKSLFGQDLAHRTAGIYELPFDMEHNTLADFDILDSVLHDSPFRSTFVVDEQPVSMFGYGSSRVMRGLKDYEEICRYTMKNIIYIAPSEREHSSYYVFKEDQRPSVERFRNKDCLDCPKQAKCLKIFSENRFKTLCGIDFWQRHGYPVAFNFMLVTARKSDNNLMPRGYVRLPIIAPKLMKEYDRIKKRNIQVFENKESLGWVRQREELQEFQKKFKDRLFNDKGKVVSKNLIKAYLMDYFGERSFTTTELDIFCAIIQSEIRSPDFVENTQKQFNEEREA